MGTGQRPEGTQGWPDWLVGRLVRSGAMDAESGATRRAKTVRCRCGRFVMRGIDADLGGMSRDVDPQPLSSLGEAYALLDNRNTFELRFLGDRYELDYRDCWRIKGSPADTADLIDVLVEHQCGAVDPLPGADSKCFDRRVASIPDNQLPDIPPY